MCVSMCVCVCVCVCAFMATHLHVHASAVQVKRVTTLIHHSPHPHPPSPTLTHPHPQAVHAQAQRVRGGGAVPAADVLHPARCRRRRRRRGGRLALRRPLRPGRRPLRAEHAAEHPRGRGAARRRYRVSLGKRRPRRPSCLCPPRHRSLGLAFPQARTLSRARRPSARSPARALSTISWTPSTATKWRQRCGRLRLLVPCGKRALMRRRQLTSQSYVKAGRRAFAGTLYTELGNMLTVRAHGVARASAHTRAALLRSHCTPMPAAGPRSLGGGPSVPPQGSVAGAAGALEG